MDILNILKLKPHNLHYLNRYYNFIVNCKENFNPDSDIYTEIHHICPKANDMFPEYANLKIFKENEVRLTGRQHFIAHHLLWKAYDWSTMSYTFKCFVDGYSSINQQRLKIKITSKMYYKLKENASKQSSKYRKYTAVYYDSQGNKIRISIHDPRIKSGEFKQKTKWIRNELTGEKSRIFQDEEIPIGYMIGTGQTWNKGICRSDEEKMKISNSLMGNKNPFYNKKHSQEAKDKMSMAKGTYMTEEDMILLIKQYKTKYDFSKNNNTIYRKIINNKTKFPTAYKLYKMLKNYNPKTHSVQL